MKLLTYLQKIKGISRRDFLEMLKEKVIYVNDKLITAIDYKIYNNDKLKIILPKGVFEHIVDFKKIKLFKPVLVLFNKPKGYVVSKNDKFNKTIFDILPKSWRKDFYYVGRLDKNSRGLLLLTNSPQIVDYYSNPKNKIIKIYLVKIDKPFSTKHIKLSKKGLYVTESGKKVDLDNLKLIKEKVDFLSFYDISYFKQNAAHYLKILLTEGKKRHIRRLLTGLGYKVIDLQRIKFGKYSLNNIKEGGYQIVKLDLNKL